MTQGHIARLTALAVATGTLVVSGVGPASAATTTTTERIFDATGAASVLRIELNLPAAVPGLLPQNIVQDIALTDGAVRTGSKPLALGNAFIGRNGNVALLQQLLGGGASSSMDNRSASYASPAGALPENPLGLVGGILTAVSEVGDPNVDGLVSSSTSRIASLELGGAGALDSILAPVQAALQQALGATAGAVAPTADGGSPLAPVTTTVTDVLNTALDALDEVTSDATAPVTDAVKAAVAQITAEINALLADLTSQVSALSATDSLLDIGLIETAQTVTRTGETVTSTATNKLVGIDLLGGLINVGGIESTAIASLGDGVTSADASATILEAALSDLVSIELTDRLETLLGGQVGALLPTDVLDQVNSALAQVTDLLGQTLGLQTPLQATTSKSATADEATAQVNPAALVLDPLRNAAAPLLRIGFVPASASVKAQSIASTVVTAAPTATATSLPRTGGSIPLALAGTALLGVALVARRRRTAAV